MFCKVLQCSALFFIGFAMLVFLPRKKPAVQMGCRKRAAAFLHRKRASNLTIQRSFVSAPPGTRTLGPLIKRNQRATIVNLQNCVNSLFLSFYRKFTFCICCILCTYYPLLHPLSSHSGVQKVCKNVQSQNQPLKQASDFYAKPGKRPGSSPKRQLQPCLFRPSIKCTSTTTIHGRDLDNRTDTTLYRKRLSYEQTAFLPLQYGHQPGGSPV